jgi:hypothetical protein
MCYTACNLRADNELKEGIYLTVVVTLFKTVVWITCLCNGEKDYYSIWQYQKNCAF